MARSMYFPLIASVSFLSCCVPAHEYTEQTQLRSPSLQNRELINACCDPEKKPDVENNSPICADGVACCPDGTWSCGIGNGEFPCGGENIPNPSGTVCGQENADDDDDENGDGDIAPCCNKEEGFLHCFIGTAKCCPNSSQWACPNGTTEEYLCPEVGIVVNPEGFECKNDDKKCCNLKDKPGKFDCDEGAECCPDGTWACDIGDGTFFCDDSLTSNPGGEVCEDPCSLPMDVGPCDFVVPRWYYNKATNSCKQFNFGGCDGNSNNFESKKECEGSCEEPCCDPRLEPGVNGNPPSREGHRCCPNGSWGYSIGDATNFACGATILTNPNGKVCAVCSLPSEVGPCEAAMKRWFYDTETDSCEEFHYGGCQGNGNNFNSKKFCDEVCNPPTEPPTLDPVTASPVDDNNELTCCDPLLQPGVLGNPPSFEGHRCCPDGSWGYSIGDATNIACGGEIIAYPNGKVCDICSQPPEDVPCDTPWTSWSLRWFYDASRGSCERFIDRGCDENSNNFMTKKDCEEICPRSTCCNPDLEPKCPSGEAACCPEGDWSCPDSNEYYMCEGDIVEGPLLGPICSPETPSSSPTREEEPSGCFPGSSIVTIEGSGRIQMKDLAIGDRVLVTDNRYESVYSFGHNSPDSVVEMLKITTSGKPSSTLRVTRDHLVFVASRKATIPAQHVCIGDALQNEKGDTVIVKSIKVVKERGLYAPFTSSGTLIVDGIFVSSYAALVPSSEYVSIFGFLLLSHHWVYHIAISPYRLVRKYVLNTLSYREEEYESNGINSSLVLLMNASKPLLKRQSFMANFVLLLIIVFLYALHGITILITAAGNCLRFALVLLFLLPIIFTYVLHQITILITSEWGVLFALTACAPLYFRWIKNKI